MACGGFGRIRVLRLVLIMDVRLAFEGKHMKSEE
jgi:hypothetical protein